MLWVGASLSGNAGDLGYRSGMGLTSWVAGVAAGLSIVVSGGGTAVAEPDSVAGAQVGVTTMHLVDGQRADPWRRGSRRELIVTMHYPAVGGGSYPVADNRLVGLPQPLVAARARVGAPAAGGARTLPVVLFSPAVGFPARTGTSMAEDLAGRGYVVVSVEDTHGALPGTVLPDGRVEWYDLRNLTDIRAAVRTSSEARAGDIRFVLDELTAMADGGHRTLPTGLAAAMDPGRVGMVGHSLGGTMAVVGDARIRAGIDLDGYPPPSYLAPGLVADPQRPLLFLFADTPDPEARRKSIDQLLAGRTGWTRRLALAGAGHWSFCDIAFAPRVITESPLLTRVFGTIGPERAHLVTRTYVAAMFDRFLRGLPAPELDAPDLFPEVSPAP